MKHMKIIDLEPGDKIKINVDNMYLSQWNSLFINHARKHIAIIQKIYYPDLKPDSKTRVFIYFIDDKGSFVKDWDFYTRDSDKLLKIVELKEDD